VQYKERKDFPAGKGEKIGISYASGHGNVMKTFNSLWERE
jgi:hypothetical protein